jgi:hypothetical protein
VQNIPTSLHGLPLYRPRGLCDIQRMLGGEPSALTPRQYGLAGRALFEKKHSNASLRFLGSRPGSMSDGAPLYLALREHGRTSGRERGDRWGVDARSVLPIVACVSIAVGSSTFFGFASCRIVYGALTVCVAHSDEKHEGYQRKRPRVSDRHVTPHHRRPCAPACTYCSQVQFLMSTLPDVVSI